MAIQIYDFTSGIGTSGIQGYEPVDRVYYENFNRPLKRLVENDVSIINGYDESVITDLLSVSAISARTGGQITIEDDVLFQGNFEVIGSYFTAYASEFTVHDNIITLNASQVLDSVLGEAGIEVDRGTASNAYIIYKEVDQYWHFSNSGVTGKNFVFENAIATGLTTSWVDFFPNTVTTYPSSGTLRFYLDTDDSLPVYQDYLGRIGTFAVSSGRYEDYIYNQETFENYFGNSALTGTGTTQNGWNYSKVGSKIRVTPLDNEKLLMKSGTYNLTTEVNLADGLLLGGQIPEDTKININFESAGFGNYYDSWVTGVEFENFTVDVNSLKSSTVDLFNLYRVRHSKFNNKVINCDSSYIYNGYESTLNLEFNGAYNNSSIVFKNINTARYDGNFYSNLTMFESCIENIAYAIIDGTQVLGQGDFGY